MQALFKRYFWVIGLVTVLVCSVFAAKATGSILEANFLGDPAKGPKVTPITSKPKVDTSARTKDGTQLASRNIFCSTCTPSEPVAQTTTDTSTVQPTSLPLSLLATSVGLTEESSSATIINTESQKQGLYLVGDSIPGASGKILAIKYKHVDFENSGRVERLSLAGITPPPPAPAPTNVAAAPPANDNRDEMEQMVDSGIKKLDDTTYEISKDLIAKVTENPMAFMKGARVVPALKNGKPEGIKLYAIRPNSPYSKLGLQNGDTLSSVNGFELTSVDKGLEIYTKLREATALELEVTRRGKPVTLKYSIK